MPSSSSSSSSNATRDRADSGDTSKSKGHLVGVAQRFPRAGATMSGVLRKKNSAGKWQKRYFEIVGGQYFVYYKAKPSNSSGTSEMLCAMDLWRASTPELLPPDPSDSDSGADFAITWDRFRTFRAGSKTEAMNWVKAITNAQMGRPDAAKRPSISAAAAAVVVENSSPARRASRAPMGVGEATALDSGGKRTAGYGTAGADSSSGGSGGGAAEAGGAGKKIAEWSTPEKTGSGKKKGKEKGADGSGEEGKKGGECCTIM